jgi:acyl-CoA thioester hydrolase
MSNNEFEVLQEVRIGDLNYGAHLGYTQMIQLIHNARVSFLSKLGVGELDCFGHWLIMVNTTVDYKSECFWGDMLKFKIKLESGEGMKVCFMTTVTHQKDDRPAAFSKDTMIFFNAETRKPVRIPQKFRELMGLV